MKLKKLLFLLIVFVIHCGNAYTQKVLSEEEDIFKEARKQYFAQNYEKAVDMFSHLTSLKPKNTTYNYYLGICFLHTKADKIKSIDYLEFAVKDKLIPNEIHFYLAKAYHLANRFDESIAEYENFKTFISTKDSRHAYIARQIEMCNNGKNLMQNNLNIKLDAKKEINKAPAYGHYDLSALGGKVISTPEHYKSDKDRKTDLNTVLYIAYNKEKLFFASERKEGLGGKDILMVNKLPTGEWALPQILDSTINTAFDEDNPFLHPDGKTLYFSSKGHNSMGGYDIFKSEFVAQDWPTPSYWTKPENLGYPINSSDDDQFFIADFDHEYAYFSSGRETSPGKMEVFKIKLPKESIPQTIIKGIFSNPGSEMPNNAHITVFDAKTKSVESVINTNPSTGEYIVPLIPGKKYSFLIEAEGMVPRIQEIYVPPQTSFYTLYQQVEMKKDDKGEDLTINNDFTNPAEKEMSEELAYINYEANTVQQIKNTYLYDESSKLSKVEINDKSVYFAPSSNTEVSKIPKEQLALAEKIENAKSTVTEEYETSTNKPAAALSTETSNNILTEEEKETEANEFSKTTSPASDELSNVNQVSSNNETNNNYNTNEQVSGSKITYDEEKTETKVEKENVVLQQSIQEMPPVELSVTVLNAFTEELKNISRQKTIEAEMAYANADEANISAQNIIEESKKIRAEAEQIKDVKEKENKIQKAIKLEEIANDKMAESKVSKEYADELKLEAEEKSKLSENISANLQQLNNKDKSKKVNETSNNKEIYNLAHSNALNYHNELKKESYEKSEKAKIALTYSNRQREKSVENYEEAQRIFEALNRMEEPDLQKESAMRQRKKAEYLDLQAKELLNDAQAAIDYSNELKETALQKEKEAEVIYASTQIIGKELNLPEQQTSAEQPIETSSKSKSNKPAKSKKEQKQAKSKDKSKQQETEISNETEPINYKLAYTKEVQYITKSKQKKQKEESALAMNTEKQEVVNKENQNVKQKATKKTNSKETPETNYEKTINNSQEIAVSDNKQGQRKQNIDKSVNKNNTITSSETRQEEQPILAFEEKEKSATEPTNKNSAISSNDKNKTIKKTKSTSEITEQELTSAQEPSANQNIKESDNTSVEQNNLSGKNQENIVLETNNKKSSVNKTGEQKTAIKNESIRKDETNQNINKKTPEIKTEGEQQETEQVIALNTSESNEENFNNTNEKPSTKTNLTSQTENTGKSEKQSVDNSVNTNSSVKKSEKEQLSDNKTEIPASIKSEQSNKKIQADNELAAKPSDNETEISETNETLPFNLNNEIADNDKAIETESFQSDNSKSNDQVNTTNSETQQNAKVSKRNNQEQIVKSESTNIQDKSLFPNVEENKVNTTNSETQKNAKVSKRNNQEQIIKNENKNIQNNSLAANEEENNERASMQDKTTSSEVVIQNPTTETNEEKLSFTEKSLENDKSELSNNQIQPSDKTSRQEMLAMNKEEKINPNQNSKKTIGNFSNNLSEKSKSDKMTLASVKHVDEKLFVFEITPKKTYTREAPIPVNTSLPEGLVFKVQVGAFRNPIPQDLFGGLNPVSGESTNMGFIRYTVGLFRAYASANMVRNKIKTMGYSDAFVVAFYNGERVSLAKALSLVNISSPEEQQAYKEIAAQETQALSNINIDEKTFGVIEELIAINQQLPEGVCYKIQIGAFSKPVSLSVFPELQNITGESTTSGLIRYTSGLFKEFNKASVHKSEAVSKGINDAFIVAYKNGERVDLMLALNSTGEVTTQLTNFNESSSVKSKTERVVSMKLETDDTKMPIFKVQVGAYNDKLPEGFQKIINSRQDITTEANKNGYTRYFAGSFDNFEAAIQIRNQFRQKGISDSFVVAYYQGKRISVPDANKMLMK